MEMVAVLGSTGKRLMPTSPYRARKLLRSERAEIAQYKPFTIRLKDRKDGYTQPVELCCDTGYIHNGYSIKSEKHEYVAFQADSLTDEKDKHESQSKIRRTRRNRKRYRKKRFDNRKKRDGADKNGKDWFAPSIKHKKEVTLSWIRRYVEVMPITSITCEMGQFDIQALQAIEKGEPLPEGTDYQRGPRYRISTLREAVFSRDNYTCQCCEKSAMKDRTVILKVHHIRYRSMGGTDRMSNLITVCAKCHTSENHQKGGKLWDWKPEVKSFKGAAYMNIIKWSMYEDLQKEFPDIDIHITYGAETKIRRRELDIRKTHINDAFTMGDFHPKHRSTPVLYKKKRRNNRCLEKFYDAKYEDTRDGKVRAGKELTNGRTKRNHKEDTENLHPYRGKKISKGRRSIRTQRYPIQPHDIVWFEGKKLEVKGCHNKGTRVMLSNGKSVKVKGIKIYRYAGGYYRSEFETIK